MKRFSWAKQFNWRLALVRILVNALALGITLLVLPHVYLTDLSISKLLLMGLVLGVLNFLVRPIVQFLTLRFIFVTYGFALVLINAVMLWLLSLVFPSVLMIEGLLWLFVGGAVLGIVSSFLEALLGLTLPVLPEEPPELRQRIAQRVTRIEELLLEAGDAPKAEELPAETEAASIAPDVQVEALSPGAEDLAAPSHPPVDGGSEGGAGAAEEDVS